MSDLDCSFRLNLSLALWLDHLLFHFNWCTLLFSCPGLLLALPLVLGHRPLSLFIRSCCMVLIGSEYSLQYCHKKKYMPAQNLGISCLLWFYNGGLLPDIKLTMSLQIRLSTFKTALQLFSWLRLDFEKQFIHSLRSGLQASLSC